MVTGATGGHRPRRRARARAQRRDGDPARPQRESARGAVSGAEAARPRAVGRADRSRARARAAVSAADRARSSRATVGSTACCTTPRSSATEAPSSTTTSVSGSACLLVDLTAPFILTRCLLPLLRNSADASIVFTTSSVGHRGRAYWGAYSVAKAGIENLAEVLADELENTPIRVNVINPGGTRTKMRARAYPAENPASVPTPESVVPPYLYLLGGASRAVRGQRFDVRDANASAASSACAPQPSRAAARRAPCGLRRRGRRSSRASPTSR